MLKRLYYGDNLDILRQPEYFPHECVDLIYLDPPFNSSRNYNVLFADESGTESEAQITAFEDTWHWNYAAQRTYEDLISQAPEKVTTTITAMKSIIGTNQMMAYLVMMAARLIELHRVLKRTGSLYLHCDPTASHYLKLILDSIFGAENFRNEIIWQRINAKGLAKVNLPNNHDVIFRYTKSDTWTWNPPFALHETEYIKKFYRYIEPDTGRRYRHADLTNPNKDRPNLTYEFLGITRVWRWTKDRMQAAYEAGLIVQTRPDGVPVLKRYLDEQRGTPLGDTWGDIPPVQGQAKERLGYPTQKPLALLERIVEMSSNEGDIVFDPFCGCGTAVAAAQKLNRQWIGIDITHLAIALQRYRLTDMFPTVEFEVIGEPKDIAGARQLADQNRYQFQWWALSLVRAKPIGGEAGSSKGKKGKDRGIDGVIHFLEAGEKVGRVIIQVKSGKVKSADIRDLKGVLDREKAEIGVFITLEDPTRDMITEAADGGHYTSKAWGRVYPRVQLLTIEELLNGKKIEMPFGKSMFKQAERVEPANGMNPLFDE